MFDNEQLTDRVQRDLEPLFSSNGGHESAGTQGGFTPIRRAPISPAGPRKPLYKSIGAYTATALAGIAIGSLLSRAPSLIPTHRSSPPPSAVMKPPTASPMLQVLVGADMAAKAAPVLEADQTRAAPTPTPAPAGAPRTTVAESIGAGATKVSGWPGGAPPRQALYTAATVAPAPATLVANGETSCGETAACADPDIAQVQRTLAEAYDHARGVGVPARDLRADQLDWREIRDSAAQLSRDDLLRAYADRIQEVWDLADSWMEATGGPGSGLGRRNGRP